MKPTQKLRIGELLIHEKLISQEQLDHALKIQKEDGKYKPLGEICIELKYITRTFLNRVITEYQKSIRLGDLFLKMGFMTKPQLVKVLAIQKQQGGKIGDIAVKNGFISDDNLVDAQSIQLGVPKIFPDLRLIDYSLFKNVKEAVLLKHGAIPAYIEDDVITVIFHNPLSEESIRVFRNIFKSKIKPAIATLSDIQSAIKLFYQGNADKQKTGSTTNNKMFAQQGKDNIIEMLQLIFTDAINEGASDIHIEPTKSNVAVRFRIDGVLQLKTSLPNSVFQKMVSRIKVQCNLDITEKRKHQDGIIKTQVMNKDVDFRVSIYASTYGENVVIRVMHHLSELMDLDSLGMSPSNRVKIQKILDQPSGILLITGPTGSGKTTVLYSALNYLNDGRKSIITVEDPVESDLEGVVQGNVDEKIGVTYAASLKSMMRQDPDVIMVGEIRDELAAETVIHAALTGHKVLTTFHTDDSTGALLRLIDMGNDSFLMSATIVAIVAQRLIRVLCSECKKPQVADKHMLASFGITTKGIEKYTFYEGVGCKKCFKTGFKGRTAIQELLFVNDSIRDYVLAKKTSAEVRYIARTKADMISLSEDGFYKATKGLTSLTELLRVVAVNESDEVIMRSVDEVVSLCEKVPDAFKDNSDNNQAASTGENESDSSLNVNNASLKGTEQHKKATTQKELYKISFKTKEIEKDNSRIAYLFKAYRQLMIKTGQKLRADSLIVFIEFIVHSIKQHQNLFDSDNVEISLLVENGMVKLILEALVKQKLSSLNRTKTKSTNNLKLVNNLDQSNNLSYIENSKNMSKKEKDKFKKKDISYLCMLSPMENESNDFRKNSTVYKRIVEELDFKSYTQ